MGRALSWCCGWNGFSDGTAAALSSAGPSRIPELVAVVPAAATTAKTAGDGAGFEWPALGGADHLDGDLQNDPADIPLLLEAAWSGLRLVGWATSVRCGDASGLLHSQPSPLIARVTGVRIHDLTACSLKPTAAKWGPICKPLCD